MKSLVDDAERVLMSGGDTDSFGSLLNEAWQLKKGFSKGISDGAIDESYNAAMQAGALGGKLLGAGGRGFLLLYAHPSKQDGIRERLAALREVSFALSPSGSEIIYQAPEA
jgi:D-glycero-alpha-D-manno-heptose-7-phosphate kinase